MTIVNRPHAPTASSSASARIATGASFPYLAQVELSFPTDSDGFFSRECPSCNRYFKIIEGEGSDEPISACPHCGHRGQDCWHTPEQLEYAQAVALSTVVAPEIDRLKRSLSGSGGGLFKMTVDNNIPRPPPPPLEVDEPYDIVRFRCCNETVKLHRLETNFCIICGKAYEMKHSDSKRIFLSHKGVDKTQVINFKQTLEGLGFAPWLDEDAMPAGTALERGILKGMEDSCAVVFFITPSFKDEGFLETEINYAIQQKRAKGERFAIIALQFVDASGKAGEIPALLKTYVWKHPKSELEALREIVRALPLSVGTADWREGIDGVVAMPKIKSTVAELSHEAKVILAATAKGGGRIMHLRHMRGTSVQAGGVSVIPDDDPRTVARWVGGLEDLRRRRYITDVGHKGEIFEMTREGYDAADHLDDVPSTV